MRILFMGTPDFAAVSLRAIFDAGYEIVGVVTQPDKPVGRGHKLRAPAVKELALELGLPVLQPSSLKGEEFANYLESLCPDLIAVVAFGKILPENVIRFPRLGCVNVHGSLLPEYRGAAPMQRAIIDGKKETGITTMLMDVGLDTGDMLFKEKLDIGENEDFGSLHDRMAELGGKMLVDTIRALENGTAIREKQDDSLSTYAAKIERSECNLDFTQPADRLCNLIRGLSPAPLALTHLPDGKMLKIISATVSDGDCPKNAAFGEVFSLERGISVKCGDGAIRITAVIPEGKGKMSAEDFVRGRKIAVGDILV